MEFEAFGKTFNIGGKKTPPAPPRTDEQIAEDIENFEFVADIATINAIPREVTRAYQVRGVLKQQAMLILGIVALFGVLWAGSSAFLAFQEGQVTKLNEERDLLKQESDALSPYQEYKQALDNKRSVLLNSTQTDINYGQMYDIITTTASQNQINLKTVDITQFAEEGEMGACISPDPLNQTSGIIGCVALTASTPNEAQLVNFLRGLENNTAVEAGFALPSVASFTNETRSRAGESAPIVNMSIFFTQKFYSKKYSDLNTPLEELIAGKSVDESTEPTEETLQDRMTGIAFKMTNELGIDGDIDNLEMLTNIATEVCETGEIVNTQLEAETIAGLTDNISAEQIAESIREKC